MPDCDFPTENENENDHNLQVNEDKTEYTIIKRGKKEDETWISVVKLASKLGDKEDIVHRKLLATIARRDNEDIWRKKRLTTRLRLYETLVKSILLYNSGTWGLTTKDDLNSFHRRQMRKVTGIKWPHKIRNNKLYKITNTTPLLKTITERRWKLLGHTRLPAD